MLWIVLISYSVVETYNVVMNLGPSYSKIFELKPSLVVQSLELFFVRY